MTGRLFTSESVTEGHPDKIADQISDSVLDEMIRQDAHIRQAAPSVNAGQKILRRGYSFTDGFDTVRGQLDAGLFFICFQRDPHKQFVPIQERLGQNDSLNEYIVHDASALFAVPPGVNGQDGFIGEGLF